MRRRTLKFIDNVGGNRKNGFSRLSLRQITFLVVGIIVVIGLTAAYLWYARTYGNARKITLTENPSLSYEWKKMAADNNIVGDYLLSRTRSRMISENGMIPSDYTVEGRLVSQVAETSSIYKLSDQSALLKAYVRTNQRSEALALKNKVLENFMSDNGLLTDYITDGNDKKSDIKISSNMDFLDAYLKFYSVYGTSKDLENVTNLVNSLFDKDGMVKISKIKVSAYVEKEYVSSDSYDEENDLPSLEQIYGSDFVSSDNSSVKEFDGVKISDIRLLLIKNLEDNDFLPKGAYDKNLKIVKESVLPSELPFYAYAYSNTKDGINYIYSCVNVATISISESVKTMENLSEVGELSNFMYSNIKSMILNEGRLPEYYFLVTGTTGGAEAMDSYDEILNIASNSKDNTLFNKVCNIVGMRVATKKTSPAYYMIFRPEGDRYKFYASENINIWLSIA